jgi:tetratricopeptide (TPR) repeat protein
LWEIVIAGIVSSAGPMANSPGIPQIPPLSPETRQELHQIGAALLDWRFWLKAAIIVGATLWVYRPIFHGGWFMDDDFYLFKNSLMNDPHRLWKAWFEPGSFIEYYPIEESVQWAQWILWGENTFGYHLTNVILHCCNALLVWRLLGKFNLRWAWLGGLIFAVHPVLVESVVWVSELKNTLSLFPFLIALCFYIEYENHNRKRDYHLALGSFLIAMLCKISMAPFPFVILLYAWWKRDRIDWKDVKSYIPFLGVSLFLVGLTLWCGRAFADSHRMDAAFPTGGLFFRIALIGQTLSFYVTTCFWPFGLLPFYSHWSLEHPSFLQLLPWPLFGAAVYWFWANRATWGRHALLGVGFFILNLAPFLGFIIVTYMRLTWVMDHFVYIPIIGLIGLVVALLEWLNRRLILFVACLIQGTFALVLIYFALCSHQYAREFANLKSLWYFTIANNPQAYPAYNNLGSIVLDENRPEDALNLFDNALKYFPDYFEAHYNRGLALDRLNRTPEAIEEFHKASLLAPRNADTHLLLAQDLQVAGNLPEAIRQYRAALFYSPDMSNIHVTLGSLLVRMGRYSEGADEFAAIIEAYPNAASPHNDLGNALYMLGQTDMALNEYREALKLNPKLVEAHNNLGGALQHNGHLDEAIKEFQAALQIDPNNSRLHVNMANALMQAGRKQDAINELEVALRYDPNNAEAKIGLAAITGPTPAKAPKK